MTHESREAFLSQRLTPGSGDYVYQPPTVMKPRARTRRSAPIQPAQPSLLRQGLAILQGDLRWNEGVAAKLPAAIAEARKIEGATVTTRLQAGGRLWQTTWQAEKFSDALAAVENAITLQRAAVWDMSNQINTSPTNPAPITVQFAAGSIVLPPITVDATVNMPPRTPIEIKYDQQGKPIGVQPVAALPTRSARPQGF